MVVSTHYESRTGRGEGSSRPPLCLPEQQIWDSVAKSNTVSAYQNYLKRYPNGRFSDIARDKLKGNETEQQIWNSAAKSNTAEVYEDYIKKYPNGSFASAARDRIEGLVIQAEQQLWESEKKMSLKEMNAAEEDFYKKLPPGLFSEIAQDRRKKHRSEIELFEPFSMLGTSAAYEDYLKKYPKGEFVLSAQEMLRVIEADQKLWNSIVKSNTVAAYQDYLKKEPYGRFAAIAKGRLKGNEIELSENELQLWASALRLRRIGAYEEYLKKHPKDSITSIARDRLKAIDAEQQLWISAAKSNTEAAYNDYLNKYPTGSFADTARDKIKTIQNSQNIKADFPARAVKLIQLPPEKIRLYNEKIKQLIVAGFPKEVKVQGQVNLTLSVNMHGGIHVDAINDIGLSVTPGDKREFVKQMILSAIEDIDLEPPSDRNGKMVYIENWQVSYSCGLFQGKLVLSTISL